MKFRLDLCFFQVSRYQPKPFCGKLSPSYLYGLVLAAYSHMADRFRHIDETIAVQISVGSGS
jgi:hypothetical protein